MLGPRPALELFLARMSPPVDKASGISNDPNEFSEDPRYVVHLTKKVIRVCVETQRLRSQLPPYQAKNLSGQKHGTPESTLR